MARTERCRHLPKVRRNYAPAAEKIVDGHAHRQHYQGLILARTEKLFGGKEPSYNIFDPKHGTHHAYVKDTKRSLVWDHRAQAFKWDYLTSLKEVPGSWRHNYERERWDACRAQAEREITLPVGSFHPFQSYEAGKRKKGWREKGNRSLRRATKQAVKDFDPDGGLLPERNEHYNKRDFY